MAPEYYTEFNATLEAHGFEKIAEVAIDELCKEAAYRNMFIDTCLNEGMTKEAAEQLYKEAAGGILKGIFTLGKTFLPRGGVINLSRIGRASRGLLSRIGSRLFGLGRTAVKGKGHIPASLAPVSPKELPLVSTATPKALTTTPKALTTTALVPTAPGSGVVEYMPKKPLPAPSLKVIGQPTLSSEVLGQAGTDVSRELVQNALTPSLMKWAPYVGVAGGGYLLGRTTSPSQPAINFSPTIMVPGAQDGAYIPGATQNGLMYEYS